MNNIDKNILGKIELKKIQKYLSFYCGNVNYALKIDYVMEIIVKHNITPLPKLPMFARGIMNLRGQIIPIVDMRVLVNKEQPANNKHSCIIVIEVSNILIGILIDGVNQVVDCNESDIKQYKSQKDEFITGISTIEGVNHLFLNPEEIVKDKCDSI